MIAFRLGVVLAMSCNRWQSDGESSRRAVHRPPPASRGYRPLAAPGAFEIGDNVGWHRLEQPVDRPVNFQGHVKELQLAVNLHRDVQQALCHEGW